MSEIRPISELLEDEFLTIEGEDITFRSILEGFHERGFGFLLFLFAFPMALPVPKPPGISTIIAIPILLLTAQQMIGRHTIWLPEKILNKSFSRDKFVGLISKSLPWIKRLEILVKPRLGFVTQGFFSCMVGFAGAFMSLFIMIPLPLTNTVPSMGIALMSIGVMMRDGLAVIGGMAIGLVWIFLWFYFAIYFGAEGIEILKQTIKSFL